ncbi:uncharacterized protein [Temnothorax longispinosus]|uniref:uncharacterized protein isoform X2 n=1 Tax=Temnothorax longispinosus TaxID=300112 RepID=UPI003A996DE5
MACWINGCTTKGGKKETFTKKSLFTARTEKMLQCWRDNGIAARGINELSKKSRICELHFEKDDTLREDIFHMADIATITVQRKIPKLKEDAVSSIFPSEISYCCLNRINEEKPKEQQNGETSITAQLKSTVNCSVSVPAECESDNPILHHEQGELQTWTEIKKNLTSLTLTSEYCMSVITEEMVMWVYWKEDLSSCTWRAILDKNMTLHICVGEREIDSLGSKIKSIEDIQNVLKKLSNINPCKEVGSKTCAKLCVGYVTRDCLVRGVQRQRCIPCAKKYKNILKKSKRPTLLQTLSKSGQSLRSRSKNISRKNCRLQNKVVRIKKAVQCIKKKCAQANTQAVKNAISKLPLNQQLSVQACLTASKAKNNKGMRYTTQWVYECLLLRIKSKKTYNHLRNHNILTLPCIDTLNRYIQAIKGCYDFQENTFKMLKEKSAKMEPSDVRGVLLLDEMKVSKTVAFNRNNLQVEGFTNLGKYTPKHQAGKKEDHALVFMFKPFKGKWVQTLGCFLSCGSASGAVLHQLVMECIILTEKSGFKVDGVASDGASWNRSMWDKFGVTEEEISVPHIMDLERRLWFFSDFPHLIKCLRNFFTKHNKYEGIWTPDGMLSLKHWYALLAIENPKSFNLKVNYKLTEQHVKPRYYQKMNVALAFQFFGVAHAMELFRNNHSDLTDCDGSIKFCTRLKALITAMNSRTPMNALKPSNQSWKKTSCNICKHGRRKLKKRDYEFITESTCYGLKVSLKTALVCTFLVQKCNFIYLMTARLNQDNLERFFGMMRHCCGSNEHPDSQLFIQMYKLVSTYSLVKPPKGCRGEWAPLSHGVQCDSASFLY